MLDDFFFFLIFFRDIRVLYKITVKTNSPNGMSENAREAIRNLIENRSYLMQNWLEANV